MKKFIMVALATLGLVFVSCDKNDGGNDDDNGGGTTPPVDTLTLLATDTNANNEVIDVFISTDKATTGHNRLYVLLTDENGSILENQSLSLTPMMDMGTHQHSAPVFQPVYNSTSRYYEAAVVFQMAMGGNWSLNFDLNGEMSSLPVEVMESTEKNVAVFEGTDTERYIVSIERPYSYEVAENDLRIYVHKMETMMSFPGDEDFEIVFTPWMPGMGHGSTGNIDPTSRGNGLYQGVFKPNMGGAWEFQFQMLKNSVEIIDLVTLDVSL